MTVVFRCDATEQTGLGHLSRCMAIAESVVERGHEVLFYGTYSERAGGLIKEAGFCQKASQGNAAEADFVAHLRGLKKQPNVVLDHYEIGLESQKEVARCCHKFFLLDDFSELSDYGHCSHVLNFTVGAEKFAYSGLVYEKLLAGPRYFPASRALQKLRNTMEKKRYGGKIQKLLVTLGGFAGASIYREVLDALSSVKARVGDLDLRCYVSEPVLKDPLLVSYRDVLSGPISNLTTSFEWADACIAGGGLTKYECSYLGLPAAIRSITPEQQEETNSFADRGLCFDLGSGGGELEDRVAQFFNAHESRSEISRMGLKSFDCDSTARIAEVLIS